MTERGGNWKERKGKGKRGVKSGEDQITLAQLCMSLVEGYRPARQLGGRIQHVIGSHSWVDKSKLVDCR